MNFHSNKKGKCRKTRNLFSVSWGGLETETEEIEAKLICVKLNFRLFFLFYFFFEMFEKCRRNIFFSRECSFELMRVHIAHIVMLFLLLCCRVHSETFSRKNAGRHNIPRWSFSRFSRWITSFSPLKKLSSLGIFQKEK